MGKVPFADDGAVHGEGHVSLGHGREFDKGETGLVDGGVARHGQLRHGTEAAEHLQQLRLRQLQHLIN